jgi:ribosome maturation factor RimP
MSERMDKIEELLAPAVADLGLELLGIDFNSGSHRALLRLYIDAPGRPVAIEDCESVSREVSALLDVHDPIASQYTLEVSSPGLDRPLFKLDHYQRFIGEQIKVTLHLPIAGRRRFHGELLGVDGEDIRLLQDGVEQRLAHRDIQRARLVPDYAAIAAARKDPDADGQDTQDDD